MSLKNLTGTAVSLKEVVLYADGACRGNPGRAAFAIVILEKESRDLEAFKKGNLPVLYSKAVAIGIATNNIAEYHSLIEGLRQLHLLGYKKARVFMDSELVIRQMKGEYKVRNPQLKTLYEEAKRLSLSLSLNFCHIPREENVLADYLANTALNMEKQH